MVNGKPVLSLDFDGVCHMYTSPWTGPDEVTDGPVPGLFEFLEKAKEVFSIHIYSARSHQPGGIEAMKQWFEAYYNDWMFKQHPSMPLSTQYPCPEYLVFDTVKVGALIGLDDRVLTFDGTWPDPVELLNFRPWNKRSKP